LDIVSSFFITMKCDNAVPPLIKIQTTRDLYMYDDFCFDTFINISDLPDLLYSPKLSSIVSVVNYQSSLSKVKETMNFNQKNALVVTSYTDSKMTIDKITGKKKTTLKFKKTIKYLKRSQVTINK